MSVSNQNNNDICNEIAAVNGDWEVLDALHAFKKPGLPVDACQIPARKDIAA